MPSLMLNPLKPPKASRLGLAIALVASAANAEAHLHILDRLAAETARVSAVTAPTSDFSKAEAYEMLSAGAATVRVRRTRDAFSQPSANLSFSEELDFKVGNGLFRKLWVSSPASTRASDGLGPLYNARSCQRCHLKDGRGHTPEGSKDSAVSIFLRVSVPGEADDLAKKIKGYIATRPEPTYGKQLQDFALPGHAPEYEFQVEYQERAIALSDGEIASLRVPAYTTANLGYGPLHPQAMLSPRIAPQMIGLGLLEAIPAADILAGADPDDADGDGVSGRANIVWSREHHLPMLGRFGLKAGAPTVRLQSASAFACDLGFPTRCSRTPGVNARRIRPHVATRATAMMLRMTGLKSAKRGFLWSRSTAAICACRNAAGRMILWCCGASRCSMTPAVSPVTDPNLSPNALPKAARRAFS